jgi:hypothetical protein
MTDEERQKLCEQLRAVSSEDFEQRLPYSPTGGLCAKAADEIERLARRVSVLEEVLKNAEHVMEELETGGK